ncbi:Charged multivesicular body protein 3 [Manis javanica]|nr:Charged multivesicular body protein 3 [Manis javanica]
MTKTGIVEDMFPDTSETMDSQEEMEEAEMEIDKILFEITAPRRAEQDRTKLRPPVRVLRHGDRMARCRAAHFDGDAHTCQCLMVVAFLQPSAYQTPPPGCPVSVSTASLNSVPLPELLLPPRSPSQRVTCSQTSCQIHNPESHPGFFSSSYMQSAPKSHGLTALDTPRASSPPSVCPPSRH